MRSAGASAQEQLIELVHFRTTAFACALAERAVQEGLRIRFGRKAVQVEEESRCHRVRFDMKASQV
jgi:hypothetical protein